MQRLPGENPKLVRHLQVGLQRIPGTCYVRDVPILRQRVSDGGFYIRANLFGQNLVTYQVTHEALVAIQREGCGVGGEVPHDLVLRLVQEEHLYKIGGVCGGRPMTGRAQARLWNQLNGGG